MKNFLIITGCIVVAAALILVAVYKRGQGEPAQGVANPNDTSSVVLETISGADFVTKWSELRGSGARLIDVRTPGEYNNGHYEGAEMIDFYADGFAGNIEELDKDTQYFIYCHSGNRSGQTLRLMQNLGFTKVYDLGGGIGGNSDILPIVAQ